MTAAVQRAYPQWRLESLSAAHASRFAARFKERFGCTPAAVRDGETAAAEYRRDSVVNVGLQP